tara:strand:- start:292 stop:726 length:435 start_codon:yes stop_codon:yes gene_type:complete
VLSSEKFPQDSALLGSALLPPGGFIRANRQFDHSVNVEPMGFATVVLKLDQWTTNFWLAWASVVALTEGGQNLQAWAVARIDFVRRPHKVARKARDFVQPPRPVCEHVIPVVRAKHGDNYTRFSWDNNPGGTNRVNMPQKALLT